MRLPTRIHGILDYVIGALLVVAPWLLGFAAGGAETWVPVVVGVAIVAYSAATHYEMGLLPRLSIPVHLWLDALLGVLLAISPWVLGFDDRVWLPHVVVGVLLVGAAAVTDTVPGFERRSNNR
jgi:hypothetical protein